MRYHSSVYNHKSSTTQSTIHVISMATIFVVVCIRNCYTEFSNNCLLNAKTLSKMIDKLTFMNRCTV